MRSLLVSLTLVAALSPALAGQTMQVTLLGTGDPTPRVDRFGPSTLIEAGGRTLLVDAGRGALQRLFQLEISTGDLDAIFLTHLHSDHVIGLVDLWLTGWVIHGRTTPLRVFGPAGTRAMVEHLKAAFAFDIDIRAREGRRSLEGVAIEVVEMTDGFRWERDGVTVTAFLVDHSPVEPAFGFRVDHGGRSVVLSGDTRYSDAVLRHGTGVDLLIHEVAEGPEALKRRTPMLPRLAHHTQAEDAGRLFSIARPRLAVYSHLVLVQGVSEDDLIPLTRRTYDGPLLVGEDLMSFTLGESITVGSRPRP